MAITKIPISQLPTVSNSTASDLIYAVQGGVSVQETLMQVLSLSLSYTILNNFGNPNGVLAGTIYQLCWDKQHSSLYICSTTGTAVTAVWTLVSNTPSTIISPTNGGTGVVNPTAHSLPIAEGASNFNFTTLTNGQLLIGATGDDPMPATLTAGVNISISNAAGSITISAANSGGIVWNDVTLTSATMAIDNGYVANNAGLVTLTLPTVAAFGTVLTILGKGAGGWTIAQNNPSQQIVIGNKTSTAGSGGSVSSNNQNDSISLVCTVANTVWGTTSMIGNLTIV